MKQSKSLMWLKKCIFPFITVLLVTSYMPIFLYASNASEVNFSEIWASMGLFCLISFGVFFFVALFGKSASRACIVSCIVILLLENYSFIENGAQLVIKTAKYWHVFPVLVYVILHICYFLCVIKEEKRKTVCNIFALVFGSLIIINMLTAIPSIINKISVQKSENYAEKNNFDGLEKGGSNFYYFLLDEAAPFNVIEDIYGYDTSSLNNFFQNNKFNVLENVYNDSLRTPVVLTNLLNLDYVVNDEMSEAEIRQKRKESMALKTILNEKGYELLGVGGTDWLFIDSLTDTQEVVAKSIDGKDFQQIFIDQTFLYPFFEKQYVEEQEYLLNTFAYFDGNIYDKESTFTFTYFNCPHQPFLFDSKGNLVSGANYSNWEDKKYYLGQYIFCMNKMCEVVENILEADPESIIIIAADHGPRYCPDMPEEKKSNVLQLVYYKGEIISELDGLSGVNILRNMLSKELNIDLPLVEVH